MTTARIPRGPGLTLVARIDGAQAAGAPVLILAHGLGIASEVFDGLLAYLPPDLRVLRWDGRGQGQSPLPAGAGPVKMGHLVADAAAVCDVLGLRDAVLLGLSMGGLVAQGLAVKRPDLVRGLILSNTAARIGTAAFWQGRADLVRARGMAPVVRDALPGWFSRDAAARGLPALWAPRVGAADPLGYAANCEALAGADFYTPTSGLRIPVLGMAGAEDRSVPPDMVRETVDLVPGSRFHLLRRQGHLPCLEDPAGYGAVIARFLREIGHIG